MKFKTIWKLGKDTFNSFSEDKALRLSAALAYYSIFSIAPLVLIVIAVVGFFMDETAVRQQIQQQLTESFGPQTAGAIAAMVGAHKQSTNVAATTTGILVLLFGASGVFGELQDSLNVIWGVQLKPGRGFWNFIRTRFLSFAMVLGIGFLLLISMVLSAVLSALTGALGRALPMPGWVAHLVNFIVSFGVITLLFAMIFKVLPDVKVKWRHVWVGAIFTALLFTIGKHLLGFYLGRSGAASGYGAAGSLVLILLWIYYSSAILFFGAEFTKVYTRATGSRVVPIAAAEPVTGETRAEQGIPHRKIPAPVQTGGPAGRRKSERPGPPRSEPAFIHGSPRARFEKALAEGQWKSVPNTWEIVREKPWAYLGAALGLGLATGWVVKADLKHRRAR